MATTTNYSWTTPDDTGLVKDGASAIRTLGSSADTTVKNLNPGTTAGDIDYYTTSTAKARIAIGTAGQVLTVNSGATAPEWAESKGMTLISTTTLTGASVNITSIPATYKNLQVIVRNYKPATDGTTLLLRFNGDATANRHQGDEYNDGTFNANVFGNTSGPVIQTVDNTVATNLSVIDICDYTNTTTWKMAQVYSIGVNDTTTTQYNMKRASIFYNQTSAISSLTFLPGAGNFTSGDVLLYGVK